MANASLCPLLVALLTSLPSSADEAMRRARELEDGGDDGAALTTLEAAVRRSPGDEVARLEAARLHLKTGRGLDLALAHTEAARSRAPEMPRAHYLFALVCEEKRWPDQAVRSLEVALAIRPDYAEARFRLAGLFYAGGQFSDAAAAYRSYLEQVPDSLGARLQLASALTRSGRAQEAEAELRRLVKEGHAPALWRLVELLETQGRNKEAQKLRRSAGQPARQLRQLKPSRR